MKNKYEFHWTNDDVTAPLFFESDSAAWDRADQTLTTVDEELEREISALKTALGEETSSSKRISMMRRLCELQSAYEYAPTIDYLIKTTAHGKVVHITR